MTFMKECTGCREMKPYDSFGRQTRSKDGLRHRCRACRAVEHKASYEKRRSIGHCRSRGCHNFTIGSANYCSNCSGREYMRRWRDPATIGTCQYPGCHNLKLERRGQFCTPCRRWAGILQRHGLTAAEYQRIHDDQGGRCAICLTTEPGSGRLMLVVDHDHAFGHVRGLLCAKCNVALGMLDDSTLRLRAAIRYLERSQPRLRLVGEPA